MVEATDSGEFTNSGRNVALLQILASTPVWAAMAVLVKVYSYLPVGQVLWIRYAVQWAISGFVIYWSRIYNSTEAEERKRPQVVLEKDLLWDQGDEKPVADGALNPGLQVTYCQEQRLAIEIKDGGARVVLKGKPSIMFRFFRRCSCCVKNKPRAEAFEVDGKSYKTPQLLFQDPEAGREIVRMAARTTAMLNLQEQDDGSVPAHDSPVAIGDRYQEKCCQLTDAKACLWNPCNQLLWGKFSLRGWVILRAICDYLAINMFYFAVALIPVADAASVFFSYNMMIYVASAIAFGDKFGVMGFMTCLACIGGVLLTTQPAAIFGGEAQVYSIYSIDNPQLWGILAALGGAITFTISITTIRKSAEVHWLQMVQAAGAVNTMFMAPAVVLLVWLMTSSTGDASGSHVWQALTWDEVAFCVALGVLGFCALMLLVQGYQGVEGGPGTIIAYLELPLTYIFQWIFLGEMPNWLSWAGMLLISASAILMAFYIKGMLGCPTKVNPQGYDAIPGDDDGELGKGAKSGSYQQTDEPAPKLSPKTTQLMNDRLENFPVDQVEQS